MMPGNTQVVYKVGPNFHRNVQTTVTDHPQTSINIQETGDHLVVAHPACFVNTIRPLVVLQSLEPTRNAATRIPYTLAIPWTYCLSCYQQVSRRLSPNDSRPFNRRCHHRVSHRVCPYTWFACRSVIINTVEPSVQPTSTQPSCQPSSSPSRQPFGIPTCQPSSEPSVQLSCEPLTAPSSPPSVAPSIQPSLQPSSRPSMQPDLNPSSVPTLQPSLIPSMQPTNQPLFKTFSAAIAESKYSAIVAAISYA